jgi:homospermidine synthase
MDETINSIDKINIKDKKILFLGYGGVAKCVWNYFGYYFIYNPDNVYIVEQYKKALYGPKLNKVKSTNILVENVNSKNFDEILTKFNFKTGDVIIDLTYFSSTYFFVNRCLELGINYINTSIEDSEDVFLGTSIDYQQHVIDSNFQQFKKKHNNKIKSTILIECGQNPGLIQHYVLYALNELNKIKGHTNKDDYSVKSLLKSIKHNKVGTILMSEIDNMYLKNKRNRTKKNRNDKSNIDTIYNTWSVAGLIGEGFDKCELVYGGNANHFIKPVLPKSLIDEHKTSLFNDAIDNDYQVLFLKKYGVNSFLNSICPVLDSNNESTKLEKFKGCLIHHGEIFELAKLFGKFAPFMSYVYKLNKYADQSIIEYFQKNKHDESVDIKQWILNHYEQFCVFDNIRKKCDGKIVGHDTIGCTLFCGKKSIDNIYWCGTILDTSDVLLKEFTPTIVQVAAGVLSGLSYILDPQNKSSGLIYSTDTNTPYILQKSIPLLGKVFFQEIPKDEFDKEMRITVRNMFNN